MSAERLPQTDSIEELARFWDTHDLTDFDDELEEVTDQVFDRESTFTVHFERDTADIVRQYAESHGFPPSKLIQIWVVERLKSSEFDQSQHP